MKTLAVAAFALTAFALFPLAGCSSSSSADARLKRPDAEVVLELDSGGEGEPDAEVEADAEVAPDATQPADAGVRDSGVRDSGVRDSGAHDAGTHDAGAHDSGVRDAGAPDSGARDAGLADASLAVDGGSRDSGVRPDGGQAADAGPSPDSGAPVDLNPGWIGGPCQSDGDCAFSGGRCLLPANGWPEGTCTEDCTQFCPDQTGPQNTVSFCIDSGSGGECLSRCDFTLSPTGCRAGYVCLPEKRHSQPSVVRYACVPPTGIPGRAAPPFDIGDACTTASDCARNTCITDLPNGYCTQEACDVVGCPAGSQCFALGTEGYHACIKTCTSSTECRQSESYGCDQDNTCWYVPPARPACDFTGAASDCAVYAAHASSTFVVVTKHLRRLAECSGTTLMGAYCVGLGESPVEDKEREGDRKTPEGTFYIPRRIPNSQYYRAFLLSYPDDADADRGLAQGLITQSEHDAIYAAQAARTEPPQSTNLGGYVELHGNGSGSDWTWGCIAVDDATIDVLWPDLQVGDNIIVLH